MATPSIWLRSASTSARARDLLVELPVDVAGQRVRACSAAPRPARRTAAGVAMRVIWRSRSSAIDTRLAAFCVPSSTMASLPRDGVHPRVELRQPGAEHRRPLEEPLERACGRSARRSRSCDGRGVRLVEVLDLLAQRLEILAALLQVLVLPGGPLGRARRPGRAIPAASRARVCLRWRSSALRVERLHLLRRADRRAAPIDAAEPVAGGEPFHALFRLADRRLQRLDALVERIELLALDRRACRVGAHEVGQRRAILLELREIQREAVAGLGAGIELRRSRRATASRRDRSAPRSASPAARLRSAC